MGALHTWRPSSPTSSPSFLPTARAASHGPGGPLFPKMRSLAKPRATTPPSEDGRDKVLVTGCPLCDPSLSPVTFETAYWQTVLNRNQNLLGKCFIALRRHADWRWVGSCRRRRGREPMAPGVRFAAAPPTARPRRPSSSARSRDAPAGRTPTAAGRRRPGRGRRRGAGSGGRGRCGERSMRGPPEPTYPPRSPPSAHPHR